MNTLTLSEFSSPATSLPALLSEDVGRLLSGSNDVTLVIDADGVIVDVSVTVQDLKAQNLTQWIGRKWIDTVAVDSTEKISEMLAILPGTESSSRQVNHLLPDGSNRLIQYQLTAFSEHENRIAVGRDLSSLERVQQKLIDVQHMMERDHTELRQCETRYRVLLQTSTEALLVVNGRTERVLEANPMAGYLLGLDPKKLIGHRLTRAFDKEAKPRVASALSDANKRDNTVTMRLGGDDERASLSLRLSRFRAGDVTQLLVRLAKDTPANTEASEALSANTDEIFTFFRNAPDALVVTDEVGTIMSANSAFVDLVELSELDAAVGQTLSTWLGRRGVDYQVIMNNLREKQTLRLFRTEMMGQYGSSVDVELSAQVNACDSGAIYGFCIRNVSRRTEAANDDSVGSGTTNSSGRSADQLAELVGQIPLKELVRESTELIEQLSIEAALRKTGNNRASAAELLGVSRQSLYVKLRRYDLEAGPEEES